MIIISAAMILFNLPYVSDTILSPVHIPGQALVLLKQIKRASVHRLFTGGCETRSDGACFG